MKKICLIIPSLGVGGMQRVLAALGNYFCEQPDTEIHLILYSIKREIYYSVSDKINIHKPPFRFNEKARILSSLQTLFFLRTEVKKINPETILSFGEYWNSFVLLAMLGMRYPIFISDRCKPDKQYSFFHHLLRKWLYPMSKGIIAQTMVAKKTYEKIFNHPNISVIGNPIRKISGNYPLQKENIVLSVGRLIPTKHHDMLIDIFLSVNDPLWKLVIVGDNAPPFDTMSLLRKKVVEKNAGDRIILAGNISEVDDYYLRSKIFAFTSSSEGFPNVIGEALSAGLPVVAFDCVAGPADMIHNGTNGFLIPLFNREEFTDKLSLLMKDDLLRNSMGAAAIKIIQDFSVSTIGNNYYNFILNGTKAN